MIASSYLAYPWLAWTALDAMHPVTFAIPLFLFAIWFLDSERIWAFALCALLILATGELMGLTLGCLGLWYWLARGQRRAGIAIACAGLAWTVICVKLVIPWFWGDESQFYGYFASIGGSPEGVLRTAITDPVRIGQALTTKGDLVYLLALAAPLAASFLLSPALVAVALPQLAANGLSSIDAATDPRGHHVAGVIPFLVVAVVFGLARVSSANRVRAAAAVLLLCVSFSLIVGSLAWRSGTAAFLASLVGLRHATA